MLASDSATIGLVNTALIVAGGIVTTWLQRHTKRHAKNAEANAAKAKVDADKARKVAEDTNRQVTPSNGRTTAQQVEDVLDAVTDLREEVRELRVDNAAVGSAFSLHLIDDHEHDPIRKATVRRNRRLDDPKEH